MTRHAQMVIAGNWKMNGTQASLQELERMGEGRKSITGVNNLKMVICVPTTLLANASDIAVRAGMHTGGQDCHPAEAGAHTGDISAIMVKDSGAAYVILGHSERRADHHETDGLVRSKAEVAIAAGLIPIICVGETLAERKNGLAETVVEHQLIGSVPDAELSANVVIAYEPVWAIGTGEIPSISDIKEIHGSIRAWLVQHFGDAGHLVSILYGGSMKPSNAADILAVQDVNGGLIGGASLKSGDFLGIVSAAAEQIEV